MVKSDMPKVSIIVPVYNVEKYIGKCVCSLMEQTIYNEMEYIFVDDCSTDGSLAKLKEALDGYPQQKSQVKIISHSRNFGSATSRNDGLDAATGEFVMFADGDDWLEPMAAAEMVKDIEGRNLDIVYCDYYETYLDHDKLIKQDYGEDNIECICSMLTRAQHGSTWNKIFLRKILLQSGQRFVDGADLYEDVGWNVRLFACTPKIGYLPKAFYHYVQYNSGSIIKSMTNPQQSRRRALQRIRNVDVACRFLEQKGLGERLRNAMDEWKLMAKNDLITASDYSLKRWMVTFPDADRAIWHCKKITQNLKLLLTWLHFHCVAMYHLQKRLTRK